MEQCQRVDLAKVRARVVIEAQRLGSEVLADMSTHDIDDVAQSATLRAVETWDESRSAITTWSCHKVRWALRHFLDDRGRDVPIGLDTENPEHGDWAWRTSAA